MINSCSTLNLISNKSWSSDIHKVDTTMHIHSTGGISVTQKMGYMGNYPTPVWYLPNGHVNILSLRDITQHYRVTMDTAVENAIILHGADKQQHRFILSGKGLYKWEHTMDPTASNPCWLFITTICDQANQYTCHAYECAQVVRRLQNIIMRPASCHMSDIAIFHLCSCPITKEDVWAADDIFGLNLGSLKGKTVWRPNRHVQAATSAAPQSILKLHQDMVLSMDIMFVNKLLFLVTSSCNLHFSTVESLPNHQVGTVTMCLKKVIRLYHHHGFHVTSITCDPEFEVLQPSFPMLNCCVADEHMPEIEWYIHTLKDHTRSVVNVLPFKNLLRVVLIHLLKNCTLWLNAFPAADRVSSVHSPHFLLTGRELLFDKHAVLEFRSYVQTHEEHSNGMEPRTMGAICLGPTGNAQGGHWFFSLMSGSHIICHCWTALPMPQEVVHCITQISHAQGMLSRISYANRHGDEISDRLKDFFDDNDTASTNSDNDTYVTSDSNSDDDASSVSDDETTSTSDVDNDDPHDDDHFPAPEIPDPPDHVAPLPREMRKMTTRMMTANRLQHMTMGNISPSLML